MRFSFQRRLVGALILIRISLLGACRSEDGSSAARGDKQAANARVATPELRLAATALQPSTSSSNALPIPPAPDLNLKIEELSKHNDELLKENALLAKKLDRLARFVVEPGQNAMTPQLSPADETRWTRAQIKAEVQRQLAEQLPTSAAGAGPAIRVTGQGVSSAGPEGESEWAIDPITLLPVRTAPPGASDEQNGGAERQTSTPASRTETNVSLNGVTVKPTPKAEAEKAAPPTRPALDQSLAALESFWGVPVDPATGQPVGIKGGPSSRTQMVERLGASMPAPGISILAAARVGMQSPLGGKVSAKKIAEADPAHAAQSAYEEFTFRHARRVFQLNFASAIATTVLAHSIVLFGLFLTWRQFRKPKEIAKEHAHELELGKEGLKLKSPVIGVVILTLSLAFYYLYLTKVYEVKVVATDGKPVAEQR